MTSTLVIVQCYRDDGGEWLKDITGCFSLQLLALALWVARRNWRIYGSELSIENIAIKMIQAPVLRIVCLVSWKNVRYVSCLFCPMNTMSY
jgi:hypothetical protein